MPASATLKAPLHDLVRLMAPGAAFFRAVHEAGVVTNPPEKVSPLFAAAVSMQRGAVNHMLAATDVLLEDWGVPPETTALEFSWDPLSEPHNGFTRIDLVFAKEPPFISSEPDDVSYRASRMTDRRCPGDSREDRQTRETLAFKISAERRFSMALGFANMEKVAYPGQDLGLAVGLAWENDGPHVRNVSMHGLGPGAQQFARQIQELFHAGDVEYIHRDLDEAHRHTKAALDLMKRRAGDYDAYGRFRKMWDPY